MTGLRRGRRALTVLALILAVAGSALTACSRWGDAGGNGIAGRVLAREGALVESASLRSGNQMDQPVIVVTVTRRELDLDVYELACDRLTNDIDASGNLDLTFEVWSTDDAFLASPAVCADPAARPGP